MCWFLVGPGCWQAINTYPNNKTKKEKDWLAC